MTQEKISYLMTKLISSIDQNKTMSIQDVRLSIEDETIFLKLADVINVEPNFFNVAEQKELIEQWQNYNSAYSTEDFEVKNNGLCLLLSYIAQNIKEIINP